LDHDVRWFSILSIPETTLETRSPALIPGLSLRRVALRKIVGYSKWPYREWLFESQFVSATV